MTDAVLAYGRVHEHVAVRQVYPLFVSDQGRARHTCVSQSFCCRRLRAAGQLHVYDYESAGVAACGENR